MTNRSGVLFLLLVLLLGLAIDPARGEMRVAPGPPCSNGYVRALSA